MEPASVRLTNADFRKLIATPRHATTTGGGSINLLTSTNSSETTSSAQIDVTTAGGLQNSAGVTTGGGEIKKKLASSERNDLRRKKKNFYAALKKQEDGKLQELSEKYRDRARERRDNINTDYQAISTPGHHNATSTTTNNNNANINTNNANNNSTSAYRAVAPDIKSVSDAAERRRRIIQESKFLGGDMEHTHLVKGLDYALLQKVRSELENKEYEEQEAAAAVAEANEKKLAAEAAAAAAAVVAAAEQAERHHNNDNNIIDENHMSIKGTMARNIYNLVQMRRSKDIQRNELFSAGRMAYVIDLSNDNNNDNMYETDIPTTLIRSKYEVPVNRDDIATLTTNDIVINKLAQILTYLRAGGRNKRNKKRDKDKPLFYDKETTTTIQQQQQPILNNNSKIIKQQSQFNTNNINIYDDIGEYQTNEKKLSKSSKNVSAKTSTTYFMDNHHSKKDKQHEMHDDDDNICLAPPPPKITKTISRFALMQNSNEPEGYAECYPGLEEMNDAIDDSDDEVDYTKMDLGNKKGPIGRWDFDTQEEYSDYMSTKEALPKAAFQYGVKMQDGRKTRKNKIERNEKAELDREWQKIQNIIQKRKTPNNKNSNNDD